MKVIASPYLLSNRPFIFLQPFIVFKQLNMSKTTIYSWGPSLVTETILKDYQGQGLLATQVEICWRVSQGENVPKPGEGEVVVFMDHILGGFTSPGSKFFRDVLHYFNLHPQDLGPNSISNLCHFQIFC